MPKIKMKIIDFGVRDYVDVLKMQETFFSNLIEWKKIGKDSATQECLLMGEHPPVITLGRRAKEENILLPGEYLNKIGVKVYHTGRGGDVTFHSPGQLIMYPILDLSYHRLGVKDYVHLLEESVIRLLEEYGVKGERVEGATGVWIDKGKKRERKISAIGIKCTRFCTMHGLSLNVNPDLAGFEMINPCGFKDKGVTSIEKEIESSRKSMWNNVSDGENLLMEAVKEELKEKFINLLN